MSEPARNPTVTPFELVGREAGVRRLTDAFYDAMEREPQFAPLRAIHAADLQPMRERLADWLTGWMGGPRIYAQRHPGRPCVVSAHAHFEIDAAMADQWLACMLDAFDEAKVSEEARALLEPAFRMMCQGLRNDFGPETSVAAAS